VMAHVISTSKPKSGRGARNLLDCRRQLS
jgi:hypothetical protein